MSCQPYNQGVSFCVELAPPHTSKKVKNVQKPHFSFAYVKSVKKCPKNVKKRSKASKTCPKSVQKAPKKCPKSV